MTLSLTQALSALSPALESTPRFAEIAVLIHPGIISCYNGNLSGWANVNEQYGPVALHATKLVKVWGDNAKMNVAEAFTTIIKGKTKYRLSQKELSEVVIPPMLRGGQLISSDLRKAVNFASKFMSTNALHLWAHGVTITNSGVLATNNQVLVKVPIITDIEVTLPPWAITALNIFDDLPIMAFDERAIKFSYSNGVSLQAQRFAAEMPIKFSEMSEALVAATEPVSGMSEALQEVNKIGGRFCSLDNYTLTVDGDNGEQAKTEIDIDGTFRMNLSTAELVFSHANYVGFEEAPQKLRFSGSHDTMPFIGIATGAI